MITAELKKLADFMCGLEELCNTHGIILGFTGHDPIIQPQPFPDDGQKRAIHLSYSECLGIRFNIVLLGKES